MNKTAINTLFFNMRLPRSHQSVGFQILIDAASQEPAFIDRQEVILVKKNIVGLFSAKTSKKIVVSGEGLNNDLIFDGCPAGC